MLEEVRNFPGDRFTLALPQDVQAEAFDWPESFFAERVWHVARPLPERSVIERAAATLEEICREETAELARLSVGLRVVRGLLS